MATLVKFASPFEIEQFVVQAVKDRVFQARVSHGQGAIFFGSNLLSSGAEDESEGPQLQTLQSQMMRRQLTTLSARLSSALGMIDPQLQAAERLARRKAVFDGAANKIEKDHQAMLHRPDEIQAREVSSYIYTLCTMIAWERINFVPMVGRRRGTGHSLGYRSAMSV